MKVWANKYSPGRPPAVTSFHVFHPPQEDASALPLLLFLFHFYPRYARHNRRQKGRHCPHRHQHSRQLCRAHAQDHKTFAAHLLGELVQGNQLAQFHYPHPHPCYGCHWRFLCEASLGDLFVLHFLLLCHWFRWAINQ